MIWYNAQRRVGQTVARKMGSKSIIFYYQSLKTDIDSVPVFREESPGSTGQGAR